MSSSSYSESKDSWHPSITTDTTKSSYWFNWRVFLCFIYVVIAILTASYLIFTHEAFRKKPRKESEKESKGNVYEDETWKPCLKGIHPVWLLVFRLVAFLVLLIIIIVIGLVDGASIFYYYTQWTFGLVTVYFGLGSLLSLNGCYQHNKRATGERVLNVENDSEQGRGKSFESHEEDNHGRKPAGFLGYVFQIVFQMNAGAVLLTDCVFWFIILPFLEIHDYSLNALVISMHSLNAIFLLVDTALNSLSFPCFRIAYFFLWTVTYVLFQWILHASVHIWWPYPFLDLSSNFVPLWYFSVAMMHFLCYGAFLLLMKLKHVLLRNWLSESYQCSLR